MTSFDPFARPAGAARVAGATAAHAPAATAPPAAVQSEAEGGVGAASDTPSIATGTTPSTPTGASTSAPGALGVAASPPATTSRADGAASVQREDAATGTSSPEESAGGPKRASRSGRGEPVSTRAATVPHQMPNRPSWPVAASGEQTYVPDDEFDAEDLSAVNRELNRARARLFRVSQELKGAQREAVEAELTYRRHMRRALVSVSGGSAESRKAMAELACEQHENDLVVCQQVVEEWKKRSMDTRDDLKAIENLSHNIRAQLGIR